MIPPRNLPPRGMDARLAVLDVLIGKLSQQVEAHERWHQDMLQRTVDNAGPKRLAVLALVIATISAIAALLTAAAALKGGALP